MLSIGVVVPCHNNSWQLYGVLSALTYQSARPETVVVVDDNSNPDEEQKLRTICKLFSVNYQKLPPPSTEREGFGRRSHARNAGTKCLDTDLILYVDGDMLLGPRYIEEIKHYHAIIQKTYIRGQRYCIPAGDQVRGMDFCLHEIVSERSRRQATPPAYIVNDTAFVWRRACEAAYYDKWDWCASNNLSVRHEHAAQIGYWDENFVGWGEEDIDFSYRLYRTGVTPIYLASVDAGAYHLEHRVDHDANARTLSANAKYLLGKFPEIAGHRKEAYARYDIHIDDF